MVLIKPNRLKVMLNNSKISAKEWVKIVILFTIFFLGSVASLNYIIDPFGSRNWLVNKEYKPIVHERSEKYNYIFHESNIHKYNCLILGSSRVMSILPFPKSNEICYNFGIHVANNPEKLFILQEWLKRAPLKTVYLGNELYNFHAQALPLYLNPSKFTHGSEGNYLSISTLLISFKALSNQLSKQSQTYFTNDGTIRYSAKEKAIRLNTYDHSHAYFQKLSIQTMKNDYLNQPFVYDQKALIPLKQLKVLCDQNKVKLYPFITPAYSDIHSSFQNTPKLAAASQRFRADLISTFGTIYDFETNHSFNANPKNFYDPIHYRPNIGNLIYERFSVNNGYGIIIKDSDAL